MMPDFYRFRCEAGDEPTGAELLIFAAIGDWEDMGEISAKAFAKDLAALPKSVKRLDIHINSPGGSLFEASAIYSRLADHRSEKVVYIDGLAASAASIVAMVGHKIYIRANGTIMVHLPQGIAMGSADDMRKMAGALDTVTESMINVYQRRTRLERDQIRSMLAAETWLSPEKAVENGFADEVRGVVKAAAMIDGTKRGIFNGIEFDLSRFHNLPAFSAIQPKGATMPEAPTPTPTPTPAPPEPTPTPEPKPEKPTGAAADPPAPDPTPPTPPPPTDVAGQAVARERERVAALQKLDRPATHDIIVKAIADGRTVTDIVGDVMSAMDKQSKHSNRRVDASALDGIPPSDVTPTGDGENDFGQRIAAAVKRKMKNRATPLLHSRN